MAPKKLYPITPRQRQILQTIADGARTYADVGQILGIGEQTVKQYMGGRQNRYLPGVFQVIEQRTERRVQKAGAVAWAIAEGLVKLNKERKIG